LISLVPIVQAAIDSKAGFKNGHGKGVHYHGPGLQRQGQGGMSQ